MKKRKKKKPIWDKEKSLLKKFEKLGYSHHTHIKIPENIEGVSTIEINLSKIF